MQVSINHYQMIEKEIKNLYFESKKYKYIKEVQLITINKP